VTPLHVVHDNTVIPLIHSHPRGHGTPPDHVDMSDHRGTRNLHHVVRFRKCSPLTHSIQYAQQAGRSATAPPCAATTTVRLFRRYPPGHAAHSRHGTATTRLRKSGAAVPPPPAFSSRYRTTSRRSRFCQIHSTHTQPRNVPPQPPVVSVRGYHAPVLGSRVSRLLLPTWPS
jgi:hypothetical protein